MDILKKPQLVEDRPPEAIRFREAKQIEYTTDTLMVGPPSISETDLSGPRLRKCPFDFEKITWHEKLGGGLDGYCWKVSFGGNGPFVVKLFWNTEWVSPGYHPIQRECQNAAVIQMMQESVAQRPVRVWKTPSSYEKVIQNHLAFSKERGQVDDDLNADPNQYEIITSVPRFRECYGWHELDPNKIPGRFIPAPYKAAKMDRSLSLSKIYTVIVYEFIEEEENQMDAVLEVGRFLFLAGFSLCIAPDIRNWKGNVLLDLCDIIWVDGYGWHGAFFGKEILLLIFWDQIAPNDSSAIPEHPLGSDGSEGK